MVKKISILFLLFCGTWAVTTCLQDVGYNINNSGVFAQGGIEGAEQTIKEVESTLTEMRAIPDLVSSDSIYVGYLLDRLYYQNSQITQLLDQTNRLLGEIHSLLEELPDDLEESLGSEPGTEVNELYNQNTRIIALLKEIRELLRQRLEEEEQELQQKR